MAVTGRAREKKGPVCSELQKSLKFRIRRLEPSQNSASWCQGRPEQVPQLSVSQATGIKKENNNKKNNNTCAKWYFTEMHKILANSDMLCKG